MTEIGAHRSPGIHAQALAVWQPLTLGQANGSVAEIAMLSDCVTIEGHGYQGANTNNNNPRTKAS
jgi:hypothetical protein